jgi:hypothetical protein
MPPMSPVHSSESDGSSSSELYCPQAMRSSQFKLAAKFWRGVENASTMSCSTENDGVVSVCDDASSCYSHASAVDIPAMAWEDVEALAENGTAVHFTGVDREQSATRFMDEFDDIGLENVVIDSNKDDFASHETLVDAKERCSFAMSFARREQLDMLKRKSVVKNCSKNPGLRVGFHSCEQKDLTEHLAFCIAELLDQNPAYIGPLTKATREFSSVFTGTEKQVFGRAVRRAVSDLRSVKQSRQFDRSSSPVMQVNVSKERRSYSLSQGMMISHKKRSTKSGPGEDVVRETVLGRLLPKQKPGRSKNETRSNVAFSSSWTKESIDLQLSFGSSLLAVLAVLARMECDLVFKRRKNPPAAGYPRETSRCAVVYARARQDHIGRPFTFSVLVMGNSPTRIIFRRPRFGTFRRIDDYVDLVVDSRHVLDEYCNSVWGEAERCG